MNEIRSRLFKLASKVLNTTVISTHIEDHEHAPKRVPLRWWRWMLGRLVDHENVQKRWAIELRDIANEFAELEVVGLSGPDVLRPKLRDCEDALRKAEARIAELETKLARNEVSFDALRPRLEQAEATVARCRKTAIGLADFERLLVRHHIIHEDAIDDPDGYDADATIENVSRLYEDLFHAPATPEESTADREAARKSVEDEENDHGVSFQHRLTEEERR